MIQGMVRNHGVSERTMGCLVKEDLGLASYARTCRHKILPGAEVRQLEQAQKLLSLLKNQRKVIIFSDKKFFPLAQ